MTIKIIQWNIKGYINNYNDLQILIKKHNPKLIALQETHITSTLNLPIPINFTLIELNSSNSYGGVALLIHNSIQYNSLNLQNDFDAIGIDLFSKVKFSLICCYIQPNKQFCNQNLENVLNINNNSAVICGDFNSWHSIWGSPRSNRRGNILAKFINKSNYVCLNDGSPTHYTTHNSLTHIDLTLCTPNMLIDAEWSTEKDLCGSDHFPIIISLFNTQSANFSSTKPKFQIDLADWEIYRENLDIISDAIPTSSNINKESANINKIVLQSAHYSIPQAHPVCRKKSVPWWNPELTVLRKNKLKTWRELFRNMSTNNMIAYKKANAQFRRKLKDVKRNSLLQFTSEINPSMSTQKVWGTIRRFCGLKTTHEIHCIEKSNYFITDKLKIAEEFAQTWSHESDDSNFPAQFCQEKNNTLIAYNNNVIPDIKSIVLENDITMIELLSALKKLKGKTPGYDRISYPMLKNMTIKTKNRLLNHYNQILNNFIPQTYKTSLIIPVLKPGKDKTVIKSYRPISLNPCCSKVLDKIISCRLWWFVTTYNLLNKNQLGFKKGKSVIDVLIFLDHTILNSLSSKGHISILSLDFTKAFDKIGIHTILDQLNHWKVGPKIMNYIYHFLTKRKIIVRVGKHYSSSQPLYNGIPQGSPLSVILFLIAYNRLADIMSTHREIQFCAYADDFNIIIRHNRQKNTQTDLNNLFQNIDNWCLYSGAILSLDKSKHLHICRKIDCNSTILANNFQFEIVTQLRILGLIFNKRYNWNNHIDALLVNLSKSLDVVKCLSSTKFNCSTLSLVNVMKALVFSKIDFGLPVYGFSANSVIKRVKSFMNNTIRTATGAFRSTPISNLYIESNTQTFENRRNSLTTKLQKNILNSKNTPIYKIIKNPIKKKNHSTIIRSIQNCKTLNIPYKSKFNTQNLHPPWTFNNKVFIRSLQSYSKSTTTSDIYKQMFLEIQNKYKDHKFIYTDGSKTQNHIGYSVTTTNTTVKISTLPQYSSVFTAEIIAITEAIKYAHTQRGKFAICTDSLSSLDAISNLDNSSYYSNLIRKLLNDKKNKVILIWVPGHMNIEGNEFADIQARSAGIFPTIITPNHNQNDISKYIKNYYIKENINNLTENTSSWYKQTNPTSISIEHFLDSTHKHISRLDTIKILRLRLGHSRITHEYLMNPQKSNICIYCNTNTISIKHILIECPYFLNIRNQIFNSIDPLNLLSTPNINNINLLLKFLKTTGLYNFI